MTELPIITIYPIVAGVIPYFVIGLNNDEPYKPLVFFAIFILVYYAGSGYGLVLSTAIKKQEVAIALVPVLVIPFLATAGFFVNQDNIAPYFYPIEYLSIFKWGFQASVLNEYQGKTLSDCPETDSRCRPLETFNYTESLEVCVILLIAIAIFMRIIAFFGLVKISTPKRAKLQPYEQAKAQDTPKVQENGEKKAEQTAKWYELCKINKIFWFFVNDTL